MTFKEPEMLTFQVNDMSCGHCVRAIKEAVRGLDPEADVDVDLARHRVRVESGRLDAVAVREALAQAGYSAVPQQPRTESAGAGCCGTARCMCAP